MINKITNITLIIAVFMAFTAGLTVLMHNRSISMEQYAVEHNCKWDFDDLCVTKEQRPWLFK